MYIPSFQRLQPILVLHFPCYQIFRFPNGTHSFSSTTAVAFNITGYPIRLLSFVLLQNQRLVLLNQARKVNTAFIVAFAELFSHSVNHFGDAIKFYSVFFTF
jgi:hypothetical protein